jgi:hypothetical protein
MSLTHPVFPPENNATTNLPTAFANLNAALRALDGADTLVIDAGATPLDTVLPRIPQVLAVHGAPGSLDGSGRYVLRLPNNGSPDQMLIVANRTTAPLRLTTASGTNALVSSLAPGRIEAFVLSGSTIGAYALSSTRTGKANTTHFHTMSEIIGLNETGMPVCLGIIVDQSVPSDPTDPPLTRIVWNYTPLFSSMGVQVNIETGEITFLDQGRYRISAQIAMGPDSPKFDIVLFENGNPLSVPYLRLSARESAFMSPPPSFFFAGDVIDLRVRHYEPTAQNVLTSSYFAVERIL